MNVDLDPTPDVQLLGDVACIRGAAAIDAFRLLVIGVDTVRRRDAIEPPVRLLKTLAALKAAAESARASMSDLGHADVRASPTSGSWQRGDCIGIGEAARMLGLGERQTRRLSALIGGRKTAAGPWVFDRSAVEAHVIERNEQSRRTSTK